MTASVEIRTEGRFDKRGRAYRRYVLTILTLVFTLNYVDRCLVALLLEPIKESLHLTDTQLGFLTGIAFGLFYATLGLPIARWADRGDRSLITATAIGLWGMTVMACIFVRSFVQLVLSRVAASVGEAGCMPPTSSLIGDYFPGATERARAMSIYWLGSPLSALLSFTIGGWLNARYGWRETFFLMGVPGLVIAVVVKITIRDPRSSGSPRCSHEAVAHTVPSILRFLWAQKSARQLGIAIVLLFTTTLGLSPWFASFMVRSHGMTSAELGLWFGVIFGVGGAAGVLSGGYIVGQWFAGDERGQTRLIAIVVAALLPCAALFLFLPLKHQALVALSIWVVGFNLILGPTFALLQRVVADEMRATVLSVVMLLANLIGMGVGSQAVGLLSDYFNPFFAKGSLSCAMLVVSLLGIWSAWHFWSAGITVDQDLRRLAILSGSATGAAQTVP